MLRIDQAGEVAAVRIASSQLWWMSPLDDGVPIVKEILGEELVHRAKMNELVEKHQVQSTSLDPAFHVGAVAMGLGTAILGHHAMMCCHAAVEDVISDHYNDQLRELEEIRSARAVASGTPTPGVEVAPTEGKDSTAGTPEPTLGSTTSCHSEDKTNEALQELQAVVAKFRDDELHHKELGEQNGAAKAPLYPLLYNGIRLACMIGVKLARRI